MIQGKKAYSEIGREWIRKFLNISKPQYSPNKWRMMRQWLSSPHRGLGH